MKKLLFVPLLFTVALTLWYCQKPKEPDPNAPFISNSTDRSEEMNCTILDLGQNPTCETRIRIRSICVPQGLSYNAWEIGSKWYVLSGNTAEVYLTSFKHFNGLGSQMGVWYNLPYSIVKESLLDEYCPGRNNVINGLVSTQSDQNDDIYVAQWSMLVDVLSGGVVTTYHLHGADGVLTPVEINGLPDQSFYYDGSDVNIQDNCSNTGYRACPQGFECFECTIKPDDPIGTGTE